MRVDYLKMNSSILRCYCDYFDVMSAVMLNLVMCVAGKICREISFEKLLGKLEIPYHI